MKKFLLIIGIVGLFSFSVEESSIIQGDVLLNTLNLEFVPIQTSIDSVHIGTWEKNLKISPFKSYIRIYSKNSKVYYSWHRRNDDFQSETDFLMPGAKGELNIVKGSSMAINCPDNYGCVPFMFYAITKDNILYSVFIDNFDNEELENDTICNYKYFPIISIQDEINTLVNGPEMEQNFQDLCAKNDTNTIGWYFNNNGNSFFRLYLINGKQPGVMVPTDDLGYETYRVSMLPHEKGFKIRALTGPLAYSGDYQILSKNRDVLFYYDRDDNLYRKEFREEVEYSEWDIGICCQEEYYNLSKKNRE